MTTPYEDPFAGSGNKFPSVSFKDAPDGTTVDLLVKSAPKLVQSRDYETGDPATWPDGNPKMSIVIEVEWHGEMRTVWASKPSALFQALADAQTQAGQRIEPGGRLRITKTHEIPNSKNPRLNPAKQYKCVYAPPDPFAGAPEWAQPAAAQPAGFPVPPPNPMVSYPPAPTAAPLMAAPTTAPGVPPVPAPLPVTPPPAPAAGPAATEGMDPAVFAALQNLNPQMLAEMAKQAGQAAQG